MKIFWSILLILMSICLFAQVDLGQIEREKDVPLSFNIENKAGISGDIKLTVTKDYSIADFKGNVNGNTLATTIKLPVGCPTGEYFIESPSFPNVKLAKFTVKGLYSKLPKKEKIIDSVELKPINEAVAGKDWRFNLDIKSSKKIESSRITLLFEKSKDVAYYGTGSEIKNSVYTISIPKTMPEGEYTVYVSLNKDIFEPLKVNINIKSNYNENNTDLKPLGYGFFTDNQGVSHIWCSNQALTYLWDGEPFFAVTGMIHGPHFKRLMDKPNWDRYERNFNRLDAHNIKHVFLPINIRFNYDIESLIDLLEEHGITYTLGYPSAHWEHYPKQYTWVVRAGLIKTIVDENKTESFTREIKLNDIQTYTYIGTPIYKVNAVIYANDKNLIAVRPCEFTYKNDQKTIIDCKVNLDNIKTPCNVTYSLKIGAEYDFVANIWEDFDYQVKFMQDKFKTWKFGPGFRGFVDLILPNERGIHNSAESTFYVTKGFMDYRINQLKEKYKTIDQLKEAWQIEGDFVSSIDEAAKLVPVYNGNKLYLVSTEDESNSLKIYTAKISSPMWYEYLDLRDISYTTLQHKALTEIKKVIDVPIFLKTIGTSKYYDSNLAKDRSGLDGIGYELYAVADTLFNNGAGYFYGEQLASNKAMISATTEMNRTASDFCAPNYPDIQAYFYDLSLTHLLGSKITYNFFLDIDCEDNNTPIYPKNYSINDQRMMEWMNLWHEIIEDKKDKIENFKAYTYNSWPKCDNWWNNPTERESIRHTDDAPGMQNVKAPNGVWVINSWRGDFKSDVTFVTLNDDPGTSYYKNDFEKLLAKNDREIVMCGPRYNLGVLSVDKYYTNEMWEDNGWTYQALNVPKGATITQKTGDKVWGMKVGKLQIIACRPNYEDSFENIVQFAKLPKVSNKITDPQKYLNKLLGIEYASYDNNTYKAVGYKLKGKDVVAFHTTKLADSNKLIFKAPKDCTIEQYLPPKDKEFNIEMGLEISKTEVKAGETIEIEFPLNDVNNSNIGAGKGTVKITGINLKDLVFANAKKDKPIVLNNRGNEKSALVEGLTLPTTDKIIDPEDPTIERQKAMAAFNRALDAYNKGDYLQADDLLIQYYLVASEKMLKKYHLILGNLKLLRGDVPESISFYTRWLNVDPNDKEILTGYGCALYPSDKAKAIEQWEKAGTVEALKNIEFAKSH